MKSFVLQRSRGRAPSRPAPYVIAPAYVTPHRSPTGFWQRLLHALRYVAAGYGPLIVVLASAPALIYYGIQPASGEFTGLLSVDGPLPAAVSYVTGPEIAPKEVLPRRAAPKFVKGLYLSANGAASSKLLGDAVALADRTEINAFVVDVKDGVGALAFATDNPALRPYVMAKPLLGELEEFTKPLREKGIYLIARVFVFQDPYYAQQHPAVAVMDSATGKVWRDRKGVSWVDPASEEAWEYTVAVSREVVRRGFDEVQFDYVRFPTDGQLATMKFPVWDGVKPKVEVMADFYAHLDRELRTKSRIPISVDLFGMVTWHHDTDLNIGQRLDIALRRFNWISPMVYPSHYPNGFDGYANPAEHPYDIVYKSLTRSHAVTDPLSAEDAAKVAAKEPFVPVATMRPWIQDFDLGADYTAPMVRAQMKASEDAGATGWLLWNARNVYTADALLPEGRTGASTGPVE